MHLYKKTFSASTEKKYMIISCFSQNCEIIVSKRNPETSNMSGIVEMIYLKDYTLYLHVQVLYRAVVNR